MIRFECDYAEGMHPRILERLVETNMEQTAGYGEDSYCERAAALIKQACGREDIDVHFLVGGTQTNLTVIGSILRPYQGVFCADTGHLNVHETGAIEATGHKVIVLPTTADGRLTAAEIRKAYEAHWNDATHEHMVQPGMVYISQSTEDGTAYTKAELEEISAICRKCELPLFIDGARLGYALAAEDCDHTLQDIARLADVFYIGGTKVGAMMGEAVVIVNPALKKDFRYIEKVAISWAEAHVSTPVEAEGHASRYDKCVYTIMTPWARQMPPPGVKRNISAAGARNIPSKQILL